MGSVSLAAVGGEALWGEGQQRGEPAWAGQAGRRGGQRGASLPGPGEPLGLAPRFTEKDAERKKAVLVHSHPGSEGLQVFGGGLGL